MPDASLQQLPAADILGAYLRGRAAPGAMQLQQQQLAEGQQAIETQGIANQTAQMRMGALQAYFKSRQQGAAPTQAGPAPTAGGGQSAAPGAVWGPGQALGMNVPQSSMTPPDLEMLGVAFGDNPLQAHLQAQQAQQAEVATQKELGAQKVLDPTNPGNPVPFLIQLNQMPSGNAQALKNNPQYLAQWEAHARQAGVKPEDLFSQDQGVADYAVKRVAYASALPTLQAVGKEGLIKAPEHYTGTVNSKTGEPIQTNDTTGQAAAMPGYSTPGYSLQEATDPNRPGHKIMVPVQTSGSRMGGGTRSSGGGAQTAGGPSAGGLDMGLTAPTTENIKQAGFAATMASGLKGVRAIEDKGIVPLSPAQRTLLIQVATRENVGDIRQLAYQMGLKKLGGDAQTYLAAMMPVIQAVSHDQSGARLNSTQIRTNLESVIPVDVHNKDAMTMINSTRDSFQKAMNVGAGSAAFAPEFNQTVGQQRRDAAAPKVVTQANVADYAQKHHMTLADATKHVQSNGYTVK